MANTIGWGKGTQNNSNGWGKFQNTIGAASVYAVSYAGETVIEGTSAAFSYSASSFHQGEADPTPTITGTTGGTFSATPSGLSINTSTGTIDLDNSTIQSYTITYTVSGVSANQTLAVTASPFIANNFSMEFDGVSSYVNAGDLSILSGATAVSVSLWFNRDTTTNQFLLDLKDGSSRIGLQLYLSNSIYFYVNNKSYFHSSSPSINQWYNLVYVFNGSGGTNADKLKMYLNGVELTGGTYSGTIDSAIGAFTSSMTSNIGRIPSTSYFNGKIDEVAIWNAALSSDAVQEIYNATYNNTGKVLDLNTDSGNYNASSNLVYFNRLGD